MGISITMIVQDVHKVTGIRVGGVIPLSSVDYPGNLATVVFTQGCPWRCRYCHNSPLLEIEDVSAVRWERILDFLKRRKGLLDGVVFSGGEPTLWPGLSSCIQDIRIMGFHAALHTNGAYPERLAALLDEGLLNWVALDIKAPFASYEKITGVPDSGWEASRSLDLVLASGVSFELRTTVHPEMITLDDLKIMAADLHDRGAQQMILQKCRFDYCLDPALRKPFIGQDAFLHQAQKTAGAIIGSALIR